MSLFVYNENAGEVYYMGRISISKVTPGMVLEADVLNEANQLILPEGLKINDKAIEKLTYYGITSVRVEGVDDDAEFLPQSDPGANTSYSDRLKKTEEYKVFKEQFESAVNEVQGFLSDVVERNMPPDTTGIMNSIQQMLHPPSGDILNVFDMIHNMKSFDDMTYVHCLNVGLICNVFGKWLGLPKEDIDLVTDGMTPLMIAVIGKNESACELLIKRGADVTIISREGKTAYDYAKEYDLTDIMELFSED